MASEFVPALSAFLAVSSATLLIYPAFCTPAGHPRTRGGDLADPEHDPIPGPASKFPSRVGERALISTT